MNFKLKSIAVATAGALIFGFGINAKADTTDDLLNALIAKGILTEEEGQLLSKGRDIEKENKQKAVAPKFKDALSFENADKSIAIGLGGRVHADYRNYDHGNNDNQRLGNTANESDTFDIRRARLELKGHLHDYYDFQLSGDFAGQTNGNTGATLDQAWLNVAYWKPLQFRVGQFKVPMSMERKMSSNALDFMERSLHDSLSTYEDRGLMVWGIPKDGLTYAVAVVNGEGNKNRNDADSRVSKPEFQVNGTINFAQLMENKDAVFHLGAGYSTTDISKNNNASGNGMVAGSATDNTFWLAGANAVRTEGRGVNFLKLPGLISADGVSNEISRDRYGAEAAVAYGPVKFNAEYLKNNFSGDLTTTTNFNADIDSWYISGLWNITGEKFADFYKEGIFTAVKPKNNFDLGDKGGYGVWQIGARYSHFDASDFNNALFASAAGGGVVNNVSKVSTDSNTFEADAYTLGINFVPTPNTRFMLNYVQTNFDTPILIENKPEDSERAITARAQFNF